MSSKRFYDILGITPAATESEIKRAYHRLALQYHPDKAGAEGAEKFKTIREAYDIVGGMFAATIPYLCSTVTQPVPGHRLESPKEYGR